VIKAITGSTNTGENENSKSIAINVKNNAISNVLGNEKRFKKLCII
tara:strand:- start:525 stop:662 length:138 start_codon:yes stop_codon:yes gene_type:complete